MQITPIPMTPKTLPTALSLPPDTGFSLISNRKLIDLYTAMLRSQLLARRSSAATRKTATAGWEAAAVAVAIDLLPKDRIAPALWAESPLNSIRPNLPVSASLDRALAAARSRKQAAKGAIAVACLIGDSITPEAWQSALRLAGEESLPMIFVSLTTVPAGPAKPGRKPVEANGHSFPAIVVDGNDVVAVYRVATEAISLARKGSGPTLIDCRRVKSISPIRTMEAYLAGKGLLPPRLKRQIAAQLRTELGVVSTPASA
jgi:TPP-dependent pyruvate/acetoin dehydrogenase alpha subunit